MHVYLIPVAPRLYNKLSNTYTGIYVIYIYIYIYSIDPVLIVLSLSVTIYTRCTLIPTIHWYTYIYSVYTVPSVLSLVITHYRKVAAYSQYTYSRCVVHTSSYSYLVCIYTVHSQYHRIRQQYILSMGIYQQSGAYSKLYIASINIYIQYLFNTIAQPTQQRI